MRNALIALGTCIVLALAFVTYASLLGLGIHRHASPPLVALAATLLVFAPPLMFALGRRPPRTLPFAGSLGAWSVLLLLGLPIYFPGERRGAIRTGLSITGSGPWTPLADRVVQLLPEEPALSIPEMPLAKPMRNAQPPTAPPPLEKHQISLPYEGHGRRLSIPVAFEHEGEILETWMMLDTGATYTTLPRHLLDQLGLDVPPDRPTIDLHTANGDRNADIQIVDRIWLGDLSLEGVTIATCDECADDDTVGLLGLNVSGRYNVTIDADRREVVFSGRDQADRTLDISPWVELEGGFRKFPGGRVEADISLENFSPRTVPSARASIRCGEEGWTVTFPPILGNDVETVSRRLPPHPSCDRYLINLDAASW